MKKIFSIGFIIILFSNGVTAQRVYRNLRVRPAEITRFERLQLQRDLFRYRIAKRNAERDGIVTPYERRKIHKIKERTRRDAARFRHNGRGRVI